MSHKEIAGTTCPVMHFEVSPEPDPDKSFFRRMDDVRRQHPIFRSDEAQGYWVLTRNELVLEALQRPEIFSSAANVPTLPDPPYRWLPIMLDPPEHTKWRRLLSAWFSPGRIAKMEDPIRERAKELVDSVLDSGSCDFVSDFAVRFPTSIFLEIIGLPVSELPRFMALVDQVLHHDSDPQAMMVAINEIREMFGGLLVERRDDPAKRSDDIISAALEWTIDDEPIPDEDLKACLLLLLLAGLDTVVAQLSYMFEYLAEHEDDRRALVEDESRIPNAVEEMLRAHPIVRLGRKVTEDVDFHGCPMKAGDMVYMPLAFASRDEDVYENATEVDIDRSVFANLSFGAGPHRCLGSHLARRELVVAVQEWHRRIPDYRVAEGAAVHEHSGLGVYGIDSLPLTWVS